jgi:hypothetical protein
MKVKVRDQGREGGAGIEVSHLSTKWGDPTSNALGRLGVHDDRIDRVETLHIL